MNGRKARKLRRKAEKLTQGQDASVTTLIYRRLKKGKHGPAS